MRTETQVLLRACSTCINWYVSNGTPNDAGVIDALCCVKGERTTGGEKCGTWKPPAR